MTKSNLLIATALIAALPAGALLGQDIPADQAAFIDAIVSSREAYDTAQNDLAKGGMRPKRAEAICEVVKQGDVSSWVGTVYNLTTNGDGWGVLSIELEGDIWVSTWNNSMSDMTDKTLIDPMSEIFTQLAALTEGQTVLFSGTFIKDKTAADCLREMSMTMDGAMDQPEFVFVFSEVAPAP